MQVPHAVRYQSERQMKVLEAPVMSGRRRRRLFVVGIITQNSIYLPVSALRPDDVRCHLRSVGLPATRSSVKAVTQGYRSIYNRQLQHYCKLSVTEIYYEDQPYHETSIALYAV